MKTKIILIIALLFQSLIFAKEYQVDMEKENIVKFISDAPIEEFEGITNNIDGYINLKALDDLSDNEIYFEVDLNTLDTGIGLRNRHMRENYLETDKYQYTYFNGKFISISKTSDGNYSIKVSGLMFIHGKTNPIEVGGILEKTDDGFHISSSFEIKLTDYNIDVPEMMFMKIDETMKIELNFNIKPMD